VKTKTVVARNAVGLVEYPHVTTDDATLGGQPCIAGTRVRVAVLASAYESGTSAVDLQEYFQDHEVAGEAHGTRLSLSEVHSALAYYYDNVDPLAVMLAENERIADAASQVRRAAILRHFLSD